AGNHRGNRAQGEPGRSRQGKEAPSPCTGAPMQTGPSINWAGLARRNATRLVTCEAARVRSTQPRDRARRRAPADTAGDRGEDHALMEIGIAPAATQIRSGPSAVRPPLGDEHYEPDQIRAVEAVVSELLG